MDNPNLTQRPPHIDPRWWATRTWHAQRRIVDAHNRANRPPENHRPGPKPAELLDRAKLSRTERVAAIEACFEVGLTAAQIVDEMGVKPATLVRYLERAGRRDLIPDFDRMVRAGRRAA